MKNLYVEQELKSRNTNLLDVQRISHANWLILKNLQVLLQIDQTQYSEMNTWTPHQKSNKLNVCQEFC